MATICVNPNNNGNNNGKWYTVSYKRNGNENVEVDYTVNSVGEVHIKTINHMAVDFTVINNDDTKLMKNMITGDTMDIDQFEAVEISGMINTMGQLLDSVSEHVTQPDPVLAK